VLREGTVSRAAQALYCHRNTVLNRLGRFKEVTGVDPLHPGDASVVRVALAVTVAGTGAGAGTGTGAGAGTGAGTSTPAGTSSGAGAGSGLGASAHARGGDAPAPLVSGGAR
jgi:hypothetical protein